MKIWIILAVVAVVAVRGTVDQWNLVHFSRNEDEIRHCLENRTDLLKVLHDNVNNSYWEFYVIDRLSHLTHSLTVGVVGIDVLGMESISILRKATSGLSENKSEIIKEAITNALIKCSDFVDGTSSCFPNGHALPRFIHEPPELADLFNFMFLPMAIIVNREGETALSLIESGLRRLRDPHRLSNELLRMWQRRARYFFDGNSILDKYIGHYNRFNDPRPCTDDDPGLYNQRMRVDYSIRDRELPEAVRSDNFFLPNTIRLTESRFHYERHKSEFLRALFLHLELIEQGFVGSYDDLPKNLSIILNGPMDYFQQYFNNRQRLELSHGFANNSIEFSPLIQSLRPGDQIDELDLLMMFWYRLIYSSNVITTTTTATFSSKASRKGKGPVTRLPSGKCRPIRPQDLDNEKSGPNYSADTACFEWPEFDWYFLKKIIKKKPLTEKEKLWLEIVHNFFSQSMAIQDELRCSFGSF